MTFTRMCDPKTGCLQLFLENIPARSVLAVMAFLVFMVTQMIRANLYIAIVGMVHHGTQDMIVNKTNESYSNATSLLPMESPDTVPAMELSNFYWDEATQGIILGAFYWCYWMTELPGGIMAQRWGSRKVLGIGVGVAGILNAFVPWVSKHHVGLLTAVRAVQGLALGVTWPAMHTLAGCWIPAQERSKFMTVYHGASIGSAITYPICGMIMDGLGWEWTFYLIAAANIFWSIGCFFFIYDSPEKHPRISIREKKYLQRQLLSSKKTPELIQNQNSFKIPWLKICTSPACWAVLAASLGVMWCSITLSMQIPTYLKKELNFDLKMNGILSGVPELSKFGFGLCFSTFMDHLLHRNVMSLTSIRKLSVLTSEYIPAALLLTFCLIDASKSTTTAVILLALTSTFGGATSSGSLANIIDISPRFAGVILGLIKTLAVIPGVLSPLAVGILTAENKTSSWYTVFFITAIIHIVCCTLFLIFGSAEIQPWNGIPNFKDGEIQLEVNLPLQPFSEEGRRNNSDDAK